MTVSHNMNFFLSLQFCHLMNYMTSNFLDQNQIANLLQATCVKIYKIGQAVLIQHRHYIKQSDRLIGH